MSQEAACRKGRCKELIPPDTVVFDRRLRISNMINVPHTGMGSRSPTAEAHACNPAKKVQDQNVKVCCPMSHQKDH